MSVRCRLSVRGTTAFLLLLVLGLLFPAPAPGQAPDTDDQPTTDPWDEGLFEVRLVDVGLSRTVLVLVDPRGVALLPLTAILQYLEIPVHAEGEELLLQWPPPTWRATIGLGDRTVRLPGSAKLVIDEDQWQQRPDEVYLGVDVMRQVIGADVHLDWENLRILISSRRDLPVAARLHNEESRGRMRGVDPRSLDSEDHTIGYSSESGGFAAGWHVAMGGAGGDVQTNARATLGAAVLGGSLRAGAGVTAIPGSHARAAAPSIQYSRAFSRDAPIRQIRLGEVVSEGLVGRAMDGVTLSNDPFHIPDYFGQVLVEPVVPAGWEYEVYQGDRLLGVSTRGESTPVPTHLGYGTNPLRIRMIGPAGQERTQQLVYLVPAMQVPAGQWRYRAGAGRCRDAACTLMTYGDIRRGITERSTVGLGLERAGRADTAGWTRPYALLGHSPRPDLRLEVRGQLNSLLHTSIQRYGANGGWLAAAGWRSDDSPAGPGTAHWYADAAAGFALPGLRNPLMASTRLRGLSGASVDAWVSSVATVVHDYHVLARYENGFQREDVFGAQISRRVPARLAGPLRDLALSSSGDATASGLRQIFVGMTARPVESSTVNASLGWVTGSRVPQLSISLVTRTPAAYLQSVASHGHGVASWFTSASGGIAHDRQVGSVMSPLDMLGQTGIAGRVFLDEDGDGEMGSEEMGLGGVPISVDGARIMTDEDGWYRYWGVLPHRVVRVGVDTLALTLPDLAPAAPAGRVRAVPNVFTRMDIPLVHTRELSGSLKWADGRALATGGITIEAHREGTSQVQRVMTFSDGEFYFGRLLPGDHTLRVAEHSLRALGSGITASEIQVRLGARDDGRPVPVSPILLFRP